MLRSKSRSADPAPTNKSGHLTSQLSRTSPSPHLRAPTVANSERTATESADLPQNENMITTITRKETLQSIEPVATSKSADIAEQEVDNMDARSSSLSDLEEASEDRAADSASKALARFNDDEFDSEAETERLEKTPRKSNAIPYNIAGTRNGVEKTPSKLAQEVVLDGTNTRASRESSPNPLIPSPITPLAELPDPNKPAHSERDSESPSRKRKRSVSATSSLSEADIPLAKRANSTKYNIEPADASTEMGDAQPLYSNGAEPVLPEEPAVNGMDNLDEELDATPAEPLAPSKGKKGGKKGKRKGKKANGGNDSEAVVEPAEAAADFEPEPVEAEAEDEEDSSRDEERARKLHAFDALRKIEQEFHSFREKHIADQLKQVNSELEALRQPENCTHHEYLAQLKCITARHDEKVRYETVKRHYDLQALHNKTVAERTQLQSQYFQEVRQIRDRWIEKCYEDLHALQKDRRQWGAHQTNYNYLYNPNRAQLIQQQTAYNLEVSILSGVAKHVGFPAAPDLTSMGADDIDADFRSMTIPERAPQPHRINLRDVERSAAEKEFFEQNAWANPSVAHAMAQSQAFALAAGRLSNGEASGMDLLMMSAPASAALSRDETPSTGQQRNANKAQRIQTTHTSTTKGMTPATGQETGEISLQRQKYTLDEQTDMFGSLGHPMLTAPVGGAGGGIRFPP